MVSNVVKNNLRCVITLESRIMMITFVQSWLQQCMNCINHNKIYIESEMYKIVNINMTMYDLTVQVVGHNVMFQNIE